MNTVWHFDEKTVRHMKGVAWGLSLLVLLFLVLLFTPAPGRAETPDELGADLAILSSSQEKGPRPDGHLGYTFEIVNQGPETASEIQLVDTLPQGGHLSSFMISQGSCTVANPVVCDLGSLETGGKIHVTFFLSPIHEGPLTNRVEIHGTEKDPNLANNQVSQTLIVAAPLAQPISLALQPRP